jgi:hypothetical protein
MHGLWLLGPAMLGFLVVGRILDLGLQRWRELTPYAAVGAVAVASAALTPVGPRLVLAPLHVREYAQFVGEWGPPSILNPYFGASFLLLAIVLVGWSVSPARPARSDVALVVGTCMLALPYIRTMPIVAIVTAPLAAAVLQSAVLHRPARPIAFGRADAVLSTGLVFAASVAAAVWLPHVPSTEHDVPVGASAFLDSLPGRAKVLNEYTEGGWLLWTARDTSPAIDGRTEIYDPNYISKLFAAEGRGRGWQKFVASQDYDAAWLYRTSPLGKGLRAIGWTIVFRDKYTYVLVPPRP